MEIRSSKALTLTWADPDLADLSNLGRTYKATYYLDFDGNRIMLDERDVFYGEVPGAPALPLPPGGTIYSTWQQLVEMNHKCAVIGVDNDFNKAIIEDSVYTIYAVTPQKLVSLMTYHAGSDEWQLDLLAVNAGDTPPAPAGHDQPKSPYGWQISNLNGHGRMINALEPVFHQYGTLMAYTYGHDTSKPLHTFTGTIDECRDEYRIYEYNDVRIAEQSVLYTALYPQSVYTVTLHFPAVGVFNSPWTMSFRALEGQPIEIPAELLFGARQFEVVGIDMNGDGIVVRDINSFLLNPPIMPSGDISIHVITKPRTYSIFVLDHEGEEANKLTVDFNAPFPIILNNPPAYLSGYVFQYWEISKGGSSYTRWNAGRDSNVFEDWTVRPVYGNVYKVTFHYSTAGSGSNTLEVELAPGRYFINAYVPYQQVKNPDDGNIYAFDGWYQDGVAFAEDDYFWVTNDNTVIEARFKSSEIPYTATITTPHGELSTGGRAHTITGTYDDIDKKIDDYLLENSMLDGEPRYTFLQWIRAKDTIGHTVTVLALWEADYEVTITFNAGLGKFIEFSGVTIHGDGKIITMTFDNTVYTAMIDFDGVIPPDNSVFTGWIDQNGKHYIPGTYYTIEVDTIFTAVYAPKVTAYTFISLVLSIALHLSHVPMTE
jgi:hypothetical protein